eukprot:4387966-Karenia_brevis.AAC.1
MKICRMQHEQGRYFAFEHPQRATSWETNIVRQMLEKEGVRLAKVDMCMFGMQAIDAHGNPKMAKKPTA